MAMTQSGDWTPAVTKAREWLAVLAAEEDGDPPSGFDKALDALCEAVAASQGTTRPTRGQVLALPVVVTVEGGNAVWAYRVDDVLALWDTPEKPRPCGEDAHYFDGPDDEMRCTCRNTTFALCAEAPREAAPPTERTQITMSSGTVYEYRPDVTDGYPWLCNADKESGTQSWGSIASVCKAIRTVEDFQKVAAALCAARGEPTRDTEDDIESYKARLYTRAGNFFGAWCIPDPDSMSSKIGQRAVLDFIRFLTETLVTPEREPGAASPLPPAENQKP